MKILHVNTHINIGGIGGYIVSLCKALKNKGVECIVASGGGDLEPELKEHGIRHMPLDIKTKFEFGPKALCAGGTLARIVGSEKVGLIHAHTRVSQVAASLASRRTGIPFISTCHGHFKPRLSRRLFDTWGTKVIAISDAVKLHLEKDFGVEPARIELIYNGVDVGRFSKSYSTLEAGGVRNSLGLGNGPVIGTMGRLSSVKGQKFLIQAMRDVLSKRADARCLIIGSGPEEIELKRLTGLLGIKDKIIFMPSTYAKIPLYLSIMDIFVLPSIEEGLGLALLEALSASKPCIASRTGGISDIIRDGINGILTPVGDSGAIAGSILKLLGDKQLGEDMGRLGRELVKEKFSIDSMSDKMIKFYERVIR